MIHLLHLVIGTALAFAAFSIDKKSEAIKAKILATRIGWLLVFITATASIIQHSNYPAGTEPIGYYLLINGNIPWLELFLSLSVLIAVSFSSIKDHTTLTFKAILYFAALVNISFSINHWIAPALGCALATIYAVAFYQRIGKSQTAIFSIYQLSGLAILLLGVFLFEATEFQQFGMGLIVLAMAIRQGLFPFSSAHIHFLNNAPFGFGFLYGCLHLGLLGFLTTRSIDWSHTGLTLLAASACITCLVAALIGLNQKDGKRSVNYLILSQSGFMTFAWAINHGQLTSDLLMMWYSTAIALIGFAGILHCLAARRGTLSLASPNGNYAHTPKMATFSLLMGLASVGFPLTLGFSAVEEIFLHSFANSPWLTTIVVLAVSINSINVMRLFFMLFTGRRKNLYEPDLTSHENWAATLNILVLFAGALVPYSLIATLN